MPQIKLSEQCGRCPREELVNLSIEEAVARAKTLHQARPKALVITVDGKELVAYDHLCEDCRGIVAAACMSTRVQKKRSARRFRRVDAQPRPKLAAARGG